VLPADRAAVDRVVAFMERAGTAIEALLAGPGKRDPWLVSTNANVRAVLSTMSRLLMDIRWGNVIIRFDQPPGAAVARYDYGYNLMHVRPVPDDNAAAVVMPNLLHEYAHALQDRETARLVVAGRGPQEHTPEAELQQELGGRLQDVYAAQLLEAVRMGPTDPNDLLAAVLGSAGFHTDFEQARTGNPAQRRAATRRLRQRLATPYAPQIAASSPAVRYPIEILGSNVARVQIRGAGGAPADIDLGAIPVVRTQSDLTDHLTRVLMAHPQFASLFRDPGGRSYVVAHFVVYFRNVDDRDEVIAQFTLRPPGPGAPAAPPAPPRP
jgi:hypothetical protein